MYLLLLALIYLAFISLGLPDSLLGAGWPVMHTFFNVPIPFMGMVTMVISGSTIVSSLMSDRLTRKFGTQWVTVVSVFMTAGALMGFSRATAFWQLLILAVPYGLGAGAIDAALNNYIALHYRSKHMSWLHSFWGVGTIISPFVMSWALAHAGWSSGYRVVSFIQLGIGLVLLLTVPVWRVNKEAHLKMAGTRRVGLAEALKIKGVPSLLLGFFAYCAAEATVMGWSSTYFVEVKGISSEKAAAYASLVFIGLTAGRFAGGFLMDRFGDRKMIVFGTVITAIGILCLMLPLQSEKLAVAAFLIIGLGYAPIYPCIIHATPGNFGAEHSGAIIGIQMASAYVGTTFMPPLYGVLGRFLGYGLMPFYLAIFIGLMIWMTEKTFRLTAGRA